MITSKLLILLLVTNVVTGNICDWKVESVNIGEVCKMNAADEQEMYFQLNYKNRPFLEFLYTLDGSYNVDSSPPPVLNFKSSYGDCYSVTVQKPKTKDQPHLVSVKSVASNNTVTVNATNGGVILRQWDDNGLYVNGIRVGPTCPLSVSLQPDDHMDVAQLTLKSTANAGNLWITYPISSTQGNPKDRKYKPRNGEKVKIIDEQPPFTTLLLMCVGGAILIGLLLGSLSAFLFVRLCWWRSLRGQKKEEPKSKVKESKKNNKNKKNSKAKTTKKDTKTPKDPNSKVSQKPAEKEKSAKVVKSQQSKAQPEKDVNIQPTQPGSDAPDNKMYENL